MREGVGGYFMFDKRAKMMIYLRTVLQSHCQWLLNMTDVVDCSALQYQSW